MVDDPLRYVLLSLSRIPPYFMFWYSPESSTLSNISRIGSFGVFLPFMLYGLFLGIKQSRRNFLISPVGLLVLFVVVYSGVHILTWTLIRYRLPVDAVLIPFAGLAIVRTFVSTNILAIATNLRSRHKMNTSHRFNDYTSL